MTLACVAEDLTMELASDMHCVCVCVCVCVVSGLFRDSLAKVCLDLQAEHVPLFIPSPNRRSAVGAMLDKYTPNPAFARAASNEIYLSMYEFVGKLMGIAVRTNNTLELDLPSIVWKALVGQELEIADLTAVDQMCVSSMTLLLDEKAMAEKSINEDNFEDVYSLDFTYPSADGHLVELVENGADQPVTSGHKQTHKRHTIGPCAHTWLGGAHSLCVFARAALRVCSAGLTVWSTRDSCCIFVCTSSLRLCAPFAPALRRSFLHASCRCSRSRNSSSRVSMQRVLGRSSQKPFTCSRCLVLLSCVSVCSVRSERNRCGRAQSEHGLLWLRHPRPAHQALLGRAHSLLAARTVRAGSTRPWHTWVQAASKNHSMACFACACSFCWLSAQFLRFTWGRSRLPVGSKLSEKMRIDSTSADITHLPSAHTCFFCQQHAQSTDSEEHAQQCLWSEAHLSCACACVFLCSAGACLLYTSPSPRD